MVRYLCPSCDAIKKGYYTTCPACHEKIEPIGLTGTYRRPVKPKVKRREEIHPTNIIFAGAPNIPLSGVSYYAEWEE